ncbi:MAG: hypothetical protein ACRD4X_04285 [Candidatus Acidiferrales bacterium]
MPEVPVQSDGGRTREPRAPRRVGQRAGERGGSKLNLFFTLLILLSMAIGAVKIAPPYVDNYQFQDDINTEARYGLTTYPKKSPDDIRREVWQDAQGLGIPASPQDIQLDDSNGALSIALDYSVPIDLYVYQFTLQFHPHADNHTI